MKRKPEPKTPVRDPNNEDVGNAPKENAPELSPKSPDHGYPYDDLN